MEILVSEQLPVVKQVCITSPKFRNADAVDNEVYFYSIKPSHRGLSPVGQPFKDFVLVYSFRVTSFYFGAVNEIDTCPNR